MANTYLSEVLNVGAEGDGDHHDNEDVDDDEEELLSSSPAVKQLSITDISNDTVSDIVNQSTAVRISRNKNNDIEEIQTSFLTSALHLLPSKTDAPTTTTTTTAITSNDKYDVIYPTTTSHESLFTKLLSQVVLDLISASDSKTDNGHHHDHEHEHERDKNNESNKNDTTVFLQTPHTTIFGSPPTNNKRSATLGLLPRTLIHLLALRDPDASTLKFSCLMYDYENEDVVDLLKGVGGVGVDFSNTTSKAKTKIPINSRLPSRTSKPVTFVNADTEKEKDNEDTKVCIHKPCDVEKCVDSCLRSIKVKVKSKGGGGVNSVVCLIYVDSVDNNVITGNGKRHSSNVKFKTNSMKTSNCIQLISIPLLPSFSSSLSPSTSQSQQRSSVKKVYDEVTTVLKTNECFNHDISQRIDSLDLIPIPSINTSMGEGEGEVTKSLLVTYLMKGLQSKNARCVILKSSSALDTFGDVGSGSGSGSCDLIEYIHRGDVDIDGDVNGGLSSIASISNDTQLAPLLVNSEAVTADDDDGSDDDVSDDDLRDRSDVNDDKVVLFVNDDTTNDDVDDDLILTMLPNQHSQSRSQSNFYNKEEHVNEFENELNALITELKAKNIDLSNQLLTSKDETSKCSSLLNEASDDNDQTNIKLTATTTELTHTLTLFKSLNAQNETSQIENTFYKSLAAKHEVALKKCRIEKEVLSECLQNVNEGVNNGISEVHDLNEQVKELTAENQTLQANLKNAQAAVQSYKSQRDVSNRMIEVRQESLRGVEVFDSLRRSDENNVDIGLLENGEDGDNGDKGDKKKGKSGNKYPPPHPPPPPPASAPPTTAMTKKMKSVSLTDLTLTLETERTLRLTAEQTITILAEQHKAQVNELQAELSEVSNERDEEVGRRVKAEDVIDCNYLKNQTSTSTASAKIKLLTDEIEGLKMSAVKKDGERVTLVKQINEKESRINTLKSETESIKSTSKSEKDKLYAVIHTLDLQINQKDDTINTVKVELDSSRSSMKRLQADLTSLQRINAENVNSSNAYKGQVGKLRRDLLDIDEQLIEAAREEGVDVSEFLKRR